MNNTNATVPSDFDFIIGSWQVAHRRLNDRLVACTDWAEFTGTSSTRKVLQGFGNLEDNVLNFPEGSVRALALRSLDTTTKTWAIWWLDGRSPHHLDVPVNGSFSGEVGTFFAEDTLAGKPIKVRFTWRKNLCAYPTWETNWTMQFIPVAA